MSNIKGREARIIIYDEAEFIKEDLNEIYN